MGGAWRAALTSPGLLRQWLLQVRILWRVLQQGGIAVSTPGGAEPPDILTVMQLDGDMVTFVASDLFERYGAAEARAQLARAHQAALERAVPGLLDPTGALHALGWTGAGVMQAGLVGYWLTAGWSWPLLMAHAAALAPVGLRWFGHRVLMRGLGYMVRREVRARTLAVVERYRHEGIAALKP